MSPEIIFLIMTCAVVSLQLTPRAHHWPGFLVIMFLLVVFQVIGAVQETFPDIITVPLDFVVMGLLAFGLSAWRADAVQRRSEIRILEEGQVLWDVNDDDSRHTCA